MEKLTIKIWSDFACPFCFIGEERLNLALKAEHMEDKVDIEYKAYQLDPNAPQQPEMSTLERLCRKYTLTVPEAQQRIENISSMGREIIPGFNFLDAQNSNTFDAHRLMKLAEHAYPGKTADKLNRLLMEAYFVKNLVVADHTVLQQVASEAGLKEGSVLEVLNSDKYADDVRSDEHEAAAMGVRGVPYLVFGDKFAVPGALSVDDFRHALKKAETLASSDSEPTAHSCGTEGCTI